MTDDGVYSSSPSRVRIRGVALKSVRGRWGKLRVRIQDDLRPYLPLKPAHTAQVLMLVLGFQEQLMELRRQAYDSHGSTGVYTEISYQLQSLDALVHEIEQMETPASQTKQEPVRVLDTIADDYRTISCLKRSLQGELQRAVCIKTGDEVALKICRKDLIAQKKSVSGKQVLEDPENEASVLLQLNTPGHPNILSIHCIVETSSSFVMVLEYAGRGEFFELIHQAGRLDNEIALTYCTSLFEAIAYIHRAGFCHLDVSLENILMSTDGQLLLSDFGLARPIGSFRAAKLHKPGKVQYMAPEIYAGEPFDGCKADLFSLGVVIFIMLAGFPPFDVPSSADRRFALIYNNQLPMLLHRWKLNRVISPLAVDLLSRLLCPPEQRLSIQEVLEHPWTLNVQSVDH